MIEINRKSKEIINYTGHSLKNIYLTVKDDHSMYLPKAVVLFCDIVEGDYMHFLNDGKEWRFYFNDNEDGFPLRKGNSKGGLFLCSVPLARMILKSMGYTKSKTFRISKTGAWHDRCPVFELVP